MHILIAEDDAPFAADTCQYLQESGRDPPTDSGRETARPLGPSWMTRNGGSTLYFWTSRCPNGAASKFCAACESPPFTSRSRWSCAPPATTGPRITEAIGLGVRHYIVKPCTEAVVTEKLKQIDLKRLAAAR